MTPGKRHRCAGCYHRESESIKPNIIVNICGDPEIQFGTRADSQYRQPDTIVLCSVHTSYRNMFDFAVPSPLPLPVILQSYLPVQLHEMKVNLLGDVPALMPKYLGDARLNLSLSHTIPPQLILPQSLHPLILPPVFFR